MKKPITFTIILLILIPLVSATVQPQEKDIYLNTGGSTGHLIYTEHYYSKDSSGNLTLEESRIYFDGIINNSKIKFLIVRPLDKKGDRYLENNIRALATLDNKTILNTWYNTENKAHSLQNTETSRIVGLIVIITTFIIGIIFSRLTIKLIIEQIKKKK